MIKVGREMARCCRPCDEVMELISSLAVPYCVASNSSLVRLTFSLERTGLFSSFEGRIFSAESVVHPKPAPDLFLYAAAQMTCSLLPLSVMCQPVAL